MSYGQAAEIVRTIERRGFRAYLVGGCVRDLWMHRQANDWDIASSARPEQIMDIFGEDVLPTGIKHGTVTLKAGDGMYEITTFRTEGGYSDGRHPDWVSYAGTIEEDLSRRDFTVNAMAMSGDGQLVDPYDGAGDIERGLIRCVGDARIRFEEDGLRILRALRFASVLGFSIETQTAHAIHAESFRLKSIAAERILSEMNKLLCGKCCREVLLRYPDVLGVFIPELLTFTDLDSRPYHDLYAQLVDTLAAVRPDSVLRWAILLDIPEKVNSFTVFGNKEIDDSATPEGGAVAAEAICTRLRMKRKDRENICALVKWSEAELPATKRELAAALLALGKENFQRLLEWKLAENLSRAANRPWQRQRIEEAVSFWEAVQRENRCLRREDLAVSGADLAARGYSGSEIGQSLYDLLLRVLAGELPNDRDRLLALL